MALSRIAVCGGINMDMVLEMDRIPDKDDSLDALSLDYFPGGKGANTAVAAFRASHNGPRSEGHEEVKASTTMDGKIEICVYMNGAVGNDAFGRQLKTKLEERGIDVSGIIIVDGEKSGTCVVLVEAGSGESRNVGYQGSNLQWKPRKEDSIECLAGGEIPDLVICDLGTPREIVMQVFATASRNGVDTLLNAAPAHHLECSTYKHITHLLLNRNEAAMLSGQNELIDLKAWGNAAAYFIQLGVKNVVITLGKRGAYYATHQGERGVVDAVANVKVVDTTGAGDTFVGMYSVEYVRQKYSGEWKICRAIARACKASARTIEQLGAQESIPWGDETAVK